MYVYSGDVRLCKVGADTEFRDLHNNLLRTGDIVVSWCRDGHTVTGLSVVVRDEFNCYFGQEPIPLDEPGEPFVMGLKTANITEPDTEGFWQVMRVKRAEDVIDGEHWKDYGFSFRALDRRGKDGR